MILNVYKEKDWTSFDVVAKLRNILKIKKVGHAGTLDPLAEGVLVILTDKDTKKQNEIMKLKKEYRAKVAFGAHSPTYDLEGDLTFEDMLPDVNKVKKKLNEVLPNYIGGIEQTVPLYSAKKVKGKRLYKLARSGKNIKKIDLPVKKVKIFDIKMDEVSKFTVKGKTLPVVCLTVVCGHGTYIRSLAHDLGEDLGTGGVLIELVRTRIGEFKVEDSKRIEEFQ